jgi:hypothetical protein
MMRLTARPMPRSSTATALWPTRLVWPEGEPEALLRAEPTRLSDATSARSGARLSDLQHMMT